MERQHGERRKRIILMDKNGGAAGRQQGPSRKPGGQASVGTAGRLLVFKLNGSR
jgi:hypothetical protein